jgi:uncharacterized membrane protein YkgB
MLVPLISHSPVVFWLLPAFGIRGAGYFLGTTEMIFSTLIFLGYWSPRLGILGALGSIVTFIGTTSIIPFLPDGWAHEAGGFPIMTLPLGFLMKDVLFLAASFYLLKQDPRSVRSRAAPEGRLLGSGNAYRAAEDGARLPVFVNAELDPAIHGAFKSGSSTG